MRFIDKTLQLLESTQARTAVISAAADWEAAFDRIDPTVAISKFLSLGTRASLVPLLISYISDRKMIVKFRNSVSAPRNLVGGGGQGTLLAGIEYIVASGDCGEKEIPEEDKFRYYNDLNMIELVILSEKLVNSNFHEHVAS